MGKKKLTQKEIGAILYIYYIDNDCEDNFSFDNGTTLNKVRNCYQKLIDKFGEDYIYGLEDDIEVSEEEGTDYDVRYYSHPDYPDIEFQITSVIDYDGKVVTGYSGDSKWIDCGLFWVDNRSYEVDFDDLNN